MGPVQNEPQFEKVASYIEVGDEEAERVLGENPGDGGQGYFVKPTIYSEVDSEARIAREEIFGPVLSVLKARDFDEALKIANDTPYGLTGGVYSRNRDHLEQARTEFKAGNVYFNRGITGALVGVQPFGGYGLSGTDSKAGGPDYLPLHMLPRTVVERF
jgi:1-pyrroline-5-carboxylate dehydrogenase